MLALGAFLNCSPLYFLSQRFSMGLESPVSLGCLASALQGSSCLCLPRVGITGVCLVFYIVSGSQAQGFMFASSYLHGPHFYKYKAVCLLTFSEVRCRHMLIL